MLALVVFLAGLGAELSWLGLLWLLVAIVVLPGIVHKKLGPVLARHGFGKGWRDAWVLLLTLTGAILCFVLEVNEPVPATVAALFFGNASLVLIRYWQNASAHVSVTFFAVLWVIATYGILWTPLLILPPLMAVSRVVLRQHSLREALWGVFLGITALGCFLVVTIWS